MNRPKTFTAYSTSNPAFSRRESSGRYSTTNGAYGAHHKQQQYTTDNLKKSSWEITPVSRLPNKSRSPSRTGPSITDKNRNTSDMRSTSKPKDMVKSSMRAGYPSVGVTTGGHSVTASKTTNNVTRPTVGNHSHQPTGAAYGGHSMATSKTAHQPTAIAKPSVREDHSTSKPDQAKYQSPVSTNQGTAAFTGDTITTTSNTAAATFTSTSTTTTTVSKPSIAVGVKSSTVGGDKDNVKGTNYHHKSNTSNDDDNKSDVKLSNSNSIGIHQNLSISTSQKALSSDASKLLTGGRTHSNSSVQGNGVIGNQFNQYTRNMTSDVGVGRSSYSTKQLVRGLSNLGNTCFYNAVMQNLTVLVILHERLKQLVNSEHRKYTIPRGDLDAEPLTVTVNTSSGYHSLTSKLCQFISNYKAGNPNPASVLDTIGNKNTRFRGRSQQDSHELFRALLDGIRTEESELIRKAIDQKLGVTPMDGEIKLMKKVYRRNIVTQIDEVFGGKTCSIVVCRNCHNVSQTIEPFLDLSLPIVDSQRGVSGRHKNRSMMDKLTTTFSGVCELLERQGVNSSTAYPMERERSHDGSCSIENCLRDYTDLEVMDDDNMFICTECNRRHQEKAQSTGKGSNEPILSPVSKLLLISMLPPVLVLHLKRFNLGYTVTKNSKHVNFSLDLNMMKYCTKLCKGGYKYRLKGVVSHSGSLNFGHYIAYVCTDNQWYYASDSSVSTASVDRVLGCEAYMLFYERTS